MIINSSTRFAENSTSSLLDHVYTNVTNKSIKSGVCIFEIFDFFPTLFIANRIAILYNNKTKFKRSMKQVKLKDFSLDFKISLSKLNKKPPAKSIVNQDVLNLTTVFSSVLDKHAPVRPLIRKEIN